MDASAVERLLAKLRAFIATELDTEEREVLAALLAPGVAAAYGDEVTGFTSGAIAPLPEVLAVALQRAGIRAVGFGSTPDV